MDPIAQFKENAKVNWSTFAPIEAFTVQAAPRLVKFAGIARGQEVLDIACGTGVVALTAACLGAKVTGIDLTPELILRARQNSALMQLDVAWHEGDAEALPVGDAKFDVVVSQFGHMFAPRPEVAVKEMLRVLKPGGTLAFSTWPPELLAGKVFNLTGKYGPPLPPGVSAPALWGDPSVIRERLGSAVKDLRFDRDAAFFHVLSTAHQRLAMEATVGPIMRVVKALSASDPEKLAAFRTEFEGLLAQYFDDNRLRQDYLMTRAIKL
jgi:SAM-dependent methyltransferase